MQYLIPFAALAFALYQASVKKFLDKYIVAFRNVKFDWKRTQQNDFRKIAFILNLDVINPTSLSGKMESANLTLYYKGKNLGYIVITDPREIHAGVNPISIPVAVDTFNVIGDAKDLVTAVLGGESLTFFLIGNVNFSVGTLQLNQKLTLDLSK